MATVIVPPAENTRRPGWITQLRLPVLLALSFIGVIVLIPIVTLLYLTFTTSSPTADAAWYERFSLEQFRILFGQVDYWRYASNSLTVSLVYTIPAVFSSMLAGYAFARLRARGSNILFAIVIATMLVPLFVYLVPLFVIYSRLGMTNTVLPWLLWGLGGNAFYIFLFRQFFDAFPSEIEDAAMLDGLNRWGIFVRVIIPNSYTPIATVSILAFTGVWGEYLVQNVLLFNDSAATLSVRLGAGVIDPTGTVLLLPATLAGIFLYLIPPVLMFIVFQRQIVQGSATSGMK
ncbi:carbohydrate ABC transporter permease [Microbacterium testaceum]|uniref:carbohydrate ABC transporter permease n=1 Tax=Microbacterium testaceum TaxID=2033 RepID=UPI0012AC6979|nr:carbohydrate ABC transporter permease [Microbacterium testaceum]